MKRRNLKDNFYLIEHHLPKKVLTNGNNENKSKKGNGKPTIKKGLIKINKKILLLGLTILIVFFFAGCVSILPTIGLAPVEEIEIVILEIFPVQIDVIARGNLPDPCTEISEVLQEREGNTLFITIKTYRSPGLCIQVLASFEEIISLEVYGLLAGTYTVDVNGVQATFDLEVDNI